MLTVAILTIAVLTMAIYTHYNLTTWQAHALTAIAHERTPNPNPNPNPNPIKAHALTAIAHERTRLVAISKQDYERLIAERRARLHAERLSFVTRALPAGPSLEPAEPSGWSDAQLRRMSFTFGETPLAPHLGQALQRQGERPDSLWIVCRGEVRVLLGKAEVAVIGPGELTLTPTLALTPTLTPTPYPNPLP